MNTDHFSSIGTPNATQGSGEKEYALGLEIKLPVVLTFPHYPAGNFTGTQLLSQAIGCALKRENLLSDGEKGIVVGVGELNQSAFITFVKNLPASYRVLLQVLESIPLLKALAAFGYYDPAALIWRPVYPGTDAPFGELVNPQGMLARQRELERLFVLDTRAMLDYFSAPDK